MTRVRDAIADGYDVAYQGSIVIEPAFLPTSRLRLDVSSRAPVTCPRFPSHRGVRDVGVPTFRFQMRIIDRANGRRTRIPCAL